MRRAHAGQTLPHGLCLDKTSVRHNRQYFPTCLGRKVDSSRPAGAILGCPVCPLQSSVSCASTASVQDTWPPSASSLHQRSPQVLLTLHTCCSSATKSLVRDQQCVTLSQHWARYAFTFGSRKSLSCPHILFGRCSAVFCSLSAVHWACLGEKCKTQTNNHHPKWGFIAPLLGRPPPPPNLEPKPSCGLDSPAHDGSGCSQKPFWGIPEHPAPQSLHIRSLSIRPNTIQHSALHSAQH